MKKSILLLSSFLLSGCAINGIPNFDSSVVKKEVIANTEKIFIGIPTLLAMEGSSARYNEDWIVTAGHNYLINRDMIKHPFCDIALIKSKGSNTVNRGLLYKNEKAFLVGYPGALPLPIAVNEGPYVLDFTGLDGCLYTAIDATIIGGMSGGGAYNQKGELIGINVGYSDFVRNDGKTFKHISFIMAFPSVQKWIDSVIAKN